MSRITKEEIEKTKCGRFLLSDENIYLSIYSLNSYVFEYNLLNTEDRILYHRLQDKFDARLINRVITRVRKQIIELLDEDKYIEAKVYFKPKKLSENGELEFRPLHSTDLITQIAIVSMLHLFVYEIPEEEEGDPKLRLSNLSRLIPSDFYGNRISVKPEYLFKPWKQQYQKYNQNSNDALMKYHTSLEYKYEVTLDLENFFPTINPIIIYHYVINHLPAYLNDEEREMMKRVLQKLLFCKLTTTFDEKTAKQYYKVTKGAGNYDNVDKKERNEKECWDFKENSDKFVRGIPQGLPQSYFLGNIYMISIAEIFRKKFTGVSYFYVDDSVIFTNDVREDNFKEQLKELNKQIADEANNFEEDSAIYPEETEKFYRSMSIKRGEKVTLSATLLFSPYPQAYFPQLCITAIVIPGRTIGSLGDMGERFSDNQRIEGTIPEMLDEALLFVKRNMRTKTIISPTTGRRTDRTDYPITAVREAIINALVHRDYSIHTEGMPIQLIMFEDRIEIHNPGGLYGRITIDQLGKIQPDTRNPVLASAFETLGITENRYSGIPTIRMEMEKYNLRQPEFLDERGSFIVKLYKESKNDYEDMSNDEETNNLIVFCKTPRTRKEICDYLGLNSVTYAIQTYVNPLVEAGVIKLSIPDKPKSPKQLYYSVEREE